MTQGDTFVLAPQVSIAEAAGLLRDLKLRVAGGGPLIIDGTAVERIDTAILQLLISCRCACQQRGTTFNWQGVSENLRRAAALIGVSDSLNLPAV